MGKKTEAANNLDILGIKLDIKLDTKLDIKSIRILYKLDLKRTIFLC